MNISVIEGTQLICVFCRRRTFYQKGSDINRNSDWTMFIPLVAEGAPEENAREVAVCPQCSDAFIKAYGT